jgi:hypothetical protein
LANEKSSFLNLSRLETFEAKYILQILGMENPENKGIKIMNKIILPNEQIADIKDIIK